jgi:hypothetical protein
MSPHAALPSAREPEPAPASRPRARRPYAERPLAPCLRAPWRVGLALAAAGLLGAPGASAPNASGPNASGQDEPPIAPNRAPAGLLDEIVDAARGGRFWVQVRPRYELRSEDARPRNAYAATLRTDLGVATGRWRGLELAAEFENTTVLGPERYFDGLNDETDRPLVRDPQDTGLNQVYADFQDDSGFVLKAGRFEYELDAGRLVGNSPWRQNHQSFDGVLARARVLGTLDAHYAWLGGVNRPIGSDSPRGRSGMGTHVARVGHTFGRGSSFAVYFLDADIDDTPAQSSATLGARLALESELTLATTGRLAVDLARQRDSAANPNDYEASYAAASAEVRFEALALRVGFESLGGGGPGSGDEFSTPLASYRAFNGAAEVFTSGSPDGLFDRFLEVRFESGSVRTVATLHDFDAERGGADLGREFDFELVWRAAPSLQFGLLLANYAAESFASDTQVVALWGAFTL